MASSIAPERGLGKGPGVPDGILASGIFLLAGVGFATLWSASSGYAISLGKPSWYFALRQLQYFAPALVLFVLATVMPIEALRTNIFPITVAGLVILLLPFVPGLGQERNGASRWISLGFTTIQPSEFWKPVSVIYLAHVLDRRNARETENKASLVLPFALVASGAGIIYFQNDFSTAFIALVVAAAVFWFAGAPLSAFLGFGAAGLSLGALIVLTSDFRLRRILAFFFPEYEPHGQSYQILGSLRAIREGGFFGKGLGLGTLKVGSIPAVQSDFIFASWAEESGFIGILAFFALWALVAGRAFMNSFREGDGFRSFLGFGLSFLLAFQVLINTAVAAGVVPATGIALPFFSAGGSSLIGSSVTAGLLVNLGMKPRSAAREEAHG
ncbi:MAG: FtsW/RodA/SpoVE family cell cycle protein [Rectinemataceae bacterium]